MSEPKSPAVNNSIAAFAMLGLVLHYLLHDKARADFKLRLDQVDEFRAPRGERKHFRQNEM